MTVILSNFSTENYDEIDGLEINDGLVKLEIHLVKDNII